MRNSTTLLVEESWREVEIAEAHEEVSSVVVLDCISLFNGTGQTQVIAIQFRENAIEGGAGTARCCERYPGNLALLA